MTGIGVVCRCRGRELANYAPQFRRDVRVACDETTQQRRLLRIANGRHRGTHLGRREFAVGVQGRLGGRMQQVLIDADEVGERLECAGERTDAGKRLGIAVIQLAALYRRQPQQVEQPPIPRQHVRAQRGHGGKTVVVVVLVGVARLVVVL